MMSYSNIRHGCVIIMVPNTNDRDIFDVGNYIICYRLPLHCSHTILVLNVIRDVDFFLTISAVYPQSAIRQFGCVAIFFFPENNKHLIDQLLNYNMNIIDYVYIDNFNDYSLQTYITYNIIYTQNNVANYQKNSSYFGNKYLL